MRILTVLLASTLLAAQTSTTGSLAGVVVDPSGALVSAAHLILKDNAKGTIQEVDTDGEGSYLCSLPRTGELHGHSEPRRIQNRELRGDGFPGADNHIECKAGGRARTVQHFRNR